MATNAQRAKVAGMKLQAAQARLAATLESPAIRFNWGCRAAELDAQHGRTRDVTGHFDSYYAAGYAHGVERHGAGLAPMTMQEMAAEQARRAL